MVRLQKQTDVAIRGAGKSIKGLNAQLASAASSARTFARAFGAGIIAGGVAEIPSALKAMVSEVSALGDQADQIGITAEKLQELNFQAEQAGSSAEVMGEGLEKFSKNLAEARRGSGELFKVLKAGGVTLEELATMDVNEALTRFVDIIGKAADASDRARLAAIGFGRGGQELGETFRGGSAEVQKFADQAHRLAQIISNETVKSAQDLDDKFAIVTGTISTLVKTEAVRFFQDISNEIDRITGLIQSLQNMAHQAGQDIASGHLQHLRDLQKAGQLPGGMVPFPGKEKDDLVLPSPKSRAQFFPGKAKDDLVITLVPAVKELTKATEEYTGASTRSAAATNDETESLSAQLPVIGQATDAQQQLIDRMDELRNAAGGALDAFAQSIQAGEGPLKALKAALEDVLQTIIRIAEQKFITSLFGAFGTAGFGAAFGGLSAPALAVAGGGQTRGGGGQMNVHITASPSPLLDLKITKAMRAAEDRAVARGPAVASNNNRRFATP